MDVEELLQALLAAFEAKELETAVSLFAPDAVLIDPHYPEPTMRGQAAIRRGLTWAFGVIEQPGFTVRRRWLAETSGAVEVDTHHRLRGGAQQRFPQVFVMEAAAGRITRLQAFVPYRPHGVGGWLARLTALRWRLRGKG